MGLIPQLVGHTTYNWTLRYLSASMIAVGLLAEPIVSTLLAFLLFSELLTALQAVGAALILTSIYLAAKGEGKA